MSTELRNVNDRLQQARFFGGKHRGPCLQITETDQRSSNINPLGVGYITVTRQEAAELAAELLLFSVGREVEAD